MIFTRFRQIHAKALSDWLRALAEEVDRLAPGTPVFAILLFDNSQGGLTVDITMKDSDAPRHGRVRFLDAKGVETDSNTTPVWASADDAVVSAVADEDGYGGTVSPGTPAPEGSASVVSVTGTDDNGNNIVATATVTVTPGDAVLGEIDFDAAA
jgi:hypothetical protein